MPRKLLDCIKKVMADGKDRSSAIAICVKSTGLKMESEDIDKLLNKELNMTKKNVVKAKLVTKKDITESYTTPFADITEASIDSDNFILNGVCLFGRKESANPRIYSNKAVDSLVNLAEGCKCYADHPTKDEIKQRDGCRSIIDWIGVFEGARRDGDKVMANFRVREAYWDLIKDIAIIQPQGMGMSINAQVQVHQADDGMESVADVVKLRSVDAVSDGATISNIWESLGNKMEENLNKDSDSYLLTETTESRIEDKFRLIAVEEGIIQDKIDTGKLKDEIRQVTWMANDLIFDIVNSDSKIDDKKKKVIAVFDDLEKEIRKRLTKLKNNTEGENTKMEITIEAVKADKGIMEALTSEFEKNVNVEKTGKELTDSKDLVTKLTQEAKEKDAQYKTDLDAKDKDIKESKEKVEVLESENKKIKVKLDEIQVVEKLSEKKNLINGLVSEAKLHKELVTETWMGTLMSIEETGEGDSLKTIEDQVKEQIEDRKICMDKSNKKSGEEFDPNKKEVKESKSGEFAEKRKEFNDDVEAFASSIN